jgi:hypothetical protein
MRVLVLFYLVVLVLLIAIGIRAQASDPAVAVSRAIHHLLTCGVPAHRILPTPRARLARDAALRAITAQAIVAAATAHGVSPYYLVAIAYREGSFRPTAVGTRNERSMFQVMPHLVRAIRRGQIHGQAGPAPACRLDTVAGSAQCAAALLRAGYDACGGRSWARAMVRYVAGGRRCTAGRSRQLAFIAWDRPGLAEALSRLGAAP